MEDIDDIVLLRDAMDRSADGLPPLPDLAPLAVREGRRRRARSRLAAGTAAFAVVTAGALGLTLLPGAGGGVAVPAASTVGGQDLPEEERAFREEYRRKMAALLDERLPAKVTGVRPEGDRVSEYRFDVGGESYRMAVSVRRIVWNGLGPDPYTEKEVAELRSAGISEMGSRVIVSYTYRRSAVSLIVYDGESGDKPVSATDIFSVSHDPRFLELVKVAGAHPMEENDPPLDPGIDTDQPPFAGRVSATGRPAAPR
ncbi:hypothetical protein ABZ615_08520 [Streptomyces sp. NPDC007325]|uniref:hypothetical protein n=1 Tax=Streptomyces sp. NPDC007325 TaxID=3154588 RepID=UPI0033CA1D8C